METVAELQAWLEANTGMGNDPVIQNIVLVLQALENRVAALEAK